MTRLVVLWAVWWSASGLVLAAAPEESGKSANIPASDESLAHRSEWEILFEDGITFAEYARQIDFFKIEIGAISKKGKVEYISKVAHAKPERRVGQKATDDRFAIGWKNGSLHAADRKLLAKAGISSDGKELWHFFPTEMQVQLVNLERAYARREPGEIKRTRFQIRMKRAGEGYEFVVLEQDPPKPTAARDTASSNKPAKD